MKRQAISAGLCRRYSNDDSSSNSNSDGSWSAEECSPSQFDEHEFPETLNREEAKTYIRYLLATDLLRTYEHQDSRMEIDETSGRIVGLRLGRGEQHFGETNSLFHLIGVSCLRHLESLTLVHCASISEDIQDLRYLRELTIQCCPYFLQNHVPDGITLRSLKRLTIVGLDREQKDRIKPIERARWLNCPPEVVWTKFGMPALEDLRFRHFEHDDTAHVLHHLRCCEDGHSFRHSLRRLEFDRCQAVESTHAGEEQLGDLLLEIVPRFPEMRELIFHDNFIEDLCGIEQRILRQDPAGLSVSSKHSNLCRLNLQENFYFDTTDLTRIVEFEIAKKSSKRMTQEENLGEGLEKVRENSRETKRKAMLTVLDTFHGIYTLCARADRTGGWDYVNVYNPKVEHRLRINHAGRRLLKGQNAVPAGLWPRILERAFRKSADIYDHTRWTQEQIESRKCATGVYYLLRHGSLLFEK